MRILANHIQTVDLSVYGDQIPPNPTSAFLTEMSTQFSDAIVSIADQISLLQQIHANQVLGTHDVAMLRKVFPAQEAFFNALPVTVVPSKTSHGVLITVLFDVISNEIIDQAKSVLNRYQAVLPTAIDTMPDGSLQTPTVRSFLTVLENLYRKSPAVAQRIPEAMLTALAANTPGVGAIPPGTPHSAIVARLTHSEARDAIALKFSGTKNLCSLCINGASISTSGLISRLNMLRASVEMLRFVVLIPQWKEVLTTA